MSIIDLQKARHFKMRLAFDLRIYFPKKLNLDTMAKRHIVNARVKKAVKI